MPRNALRRSPPLTASARRRIALAVALLVVVATAFAWAWRTPPSAPPPPAPSVRAVRATVLSHGSHALRIATFGELRARRRIALRTLVSGTVLSTSERFDVGARVDVGDVLLRIDPVRHRLALLEARAARDGALARLSEREAMRDATAKELARTEKLFASGTVPERTLDDKRLDHAVKTARRDDARATVDARRAALERAREDVKNTGVVAPFDAYVDEVTAFVGGIVNPGDALATLIDARDYEVVFNLPADRLPIHLDALVGLPVAAHRSDDGARTPLRAVVRRLGPVVSPTTGGPDVFASLVDAPPANLRAGAHLAVSFRIPLPYDTIAVPRDAVRDDGVVFLIDDGRLRRQALGAFLDDGNRVLVRDGLVDGDVLLLTRIDDVSPGMVVDVVDVVDDAPLGPS